MQAEPGWRGCPSQGATCLGATRSVRQAGAPQRATHPTPSKTFCVHRHISRGALQPVRSGACRRALPPRVWPQSPVTPRTTCLCTTLHRGVRVHSLRCDPAQAASVSRRTKTSGQPWPPTAAASLTLCRHPTRACLVRFPSHTSTPAMHACTPTHQQPHECSSAPIEPPATPSSAITASQPLQRILHTKQTARTRANTRSTRACGHTPMLHASAPERPAS